MMTSNLEKMLEIVHPKFLEEDYGMLMRMLKDDVLDDVVFNYTLRTSRPVKGKDLMLHPQLTNHQALTYQGKGLVHDIVHHAQKEQVMNVYIISIDME